jgi:hypothetical protein
MTPEEMSDIANALMMGLRNRYPEGINLNHAALVMASLSVKLLHDNGMKAEVVQSSIIDYLEGVTLDDITPVSIN